MSLATLATAHVEAALRGRPLVVMHAQRATPEARLAVLLFLRSWVHGRRWLS